MVKRYYGARIVDSWPVDATVEATGFEDGVILQLGTDGEAELATDGQSVVVGLALDATTETSATRGVGGILDGKVDVILDDTVVDTDQIASGVTISVNEKLYVAAGKLTNVAGSGIAVGMALADQADGVLHWLFRPEY